MIKLAANLSFLYAQVDFLDRFALAAKDGFKGVEYLFPYQWQMSEIASRLEDGGLHQALFSMSPGHWDKGDRGLASHPDKKDIFKRTVDQSLEYADALNCSKIHAMAGLKLPGLSQEKQLETYLQNLSYAARQAAPHGVDILIEPINPVDMPNYFLSDFDFASKIITAVNEPNLWLEFDIYHCQRIHGNLSVNLQKYLPQTKHIQIANPPKRNEPSAGEINFPYLFDLIDKHSYEGWIGCEYVPSGDTSETLKWAEDYLQPS